MYKHKLIDIVKQDAKLTFIQDGKAFYEIYVDDIVYEVPVPVSDIGNGSLNRDEKGILLMRWIRKAMESQEMRATSLVI
jgi:hypothetical protein